MKKVMHVAIVAALSLGISGCSYRTQSGISLPDKISTKLSILITDKNLYDKQCKTVEHIHASVKKLTIFHNDPTKEQVDYVLSEKAKILHANVVRNVTYTLGFGFTTWGYLDAEGDASRCKNVNYK